MAIEKLPIIELDQLISAGQIDALSLRGLAEQPNGLQVLERFRKGAENIIIDFDRRWITLCDGDVHELTEWGSRMRLTRVHFDEIDRHLLAKGTRLFNWETVLRSMGFINAFRVAYEQVIAHNEQLKTA